MIKHAPEPHLRTGRKAGRDVWRVLAVHPHGRVEALGTEPFCTKLKASGVKARSFQVNMLQGWVFTCFALGVSLQG